MAPIETPIKQSDLYRFLALSMKYPERTWLDNDYLSLFFAFLQELHWDDDAARIREHLDRAPDWLESLQIEYTRLFINAVPHVVAPPYASVYLSGDGRLQGPTTEKTRQFYREQGFDLAAEEEVPDSLAHELEFLALLSELERSEAEEDFLERFFRPWFALFADRVQQEAHHPFYPAVVRLIDFFTTEEE